MGNLKNRNYSKHNKIDETKSIYHYGTIERVRIGKLPDERQSQCGGTCQRTERRLKENVRKVPAFHHDFRYSGILRG